MTAKPWRARRTLKRAQYMLLAIALVCLGAYGLNYGRAALVQSYQGWRLDQASGRDRHSSLAPFYRWWERKHSAGNASPANSSAGTARRESLPAAPALPEGSLVGRVEIPRLGVSVMVLEGDDEEILQKAAGHVPTTALPSGAGNVVIAGHRDTFFRQLRNIRLGDEIALTTVAGTYTYHVDSTEKVTPKDVQVLKASSHPTLTLITCYPFNFIGSAPLRFVVAASEVSAPKPGAEGRLLAGNFETEDVHFVSPRAGGGAPHKAALAAHREKPNDKFGVEANAFADGSESRRKGTALHRSAKTADGSVHKSAHEAATADSDDSTVDSPLDYKKHSKRHGLLGFFSRHFRKDKTHSDSSSNAASNY